MVEKARDGFFNGLLSVGGCGGSCAAVIFDIGQLRQSAALEKFIIVIEMSYGYAAQRGSWPVITTKERGGSSR
jgi:hypothetical protein